MKTKTFLLIVLFSIGISTNGFAQKNSATLDQTIEWINNYLGANGSALQFGNYSDDRKRYFAAFTFDPSSKILSMIEKHEYGEIHSEIIINLSECSSVKKGRLTSSSSEFAKYVITNDKGYKSKSDIYSNVILFELNENGDYTKLDNALKHLCELCGIKLMNEDLF